MKILSVFLMLFTFAAKAQVNLDQPVTVGPSDQVYKSTADVNVAYLIPTTLMVLGEPRLSEIDGEIRADFEVGMNQSTYQGVAAKIVAPMQLRMMRGFEAKIDTKGSMDTPSKFEAELTPLGDAGALGETLKYVFSAKKIGPKLGKETYALFKELFGSKTARHLGTVLYEFNAIRGGQPYQARSAVGIFATNVMPADSVHALSLTSINGLLQEVPEVITPEVVMDKSSPCWDNLKIGQICLR